MYECYVRGIILCAYCVRSMYKCHNMTFNNKVLNINYLLITISLYSLYDPIADKVLLSCTYPLLLNHL